MILNQKMTKNEAIEIIKSFVMTFIDELHPVFVNEIKEAITIIEGLKDDTTTDEEGI
jgi:hypothetical protein